MQEEMTKNSEIIKITEEGIDEYKKLSESLNKETEWRKEVEKELKLKEERLELVLEIADYGLWDYNFVNDQVYFNKNFSSILGIDNNKNQLLGLKDLENFIHPAHRELFVATFSKHASMQLPFFEAEVKVLINGNIKWVLARGKIVQRDSDLNPLRFIGKLEDITSRKNNEENMRLDLLKNKELNELKSKFVSMLSHEIRNPLSQILSSAEILEMFINEMPDEEKLELIQKIQKSVDKLTGILNDAVNIDNSELLNKETDYSEFDVVQFCEKIINEIKTQREHCPDIHLQSDKTNLIIKSDANELRQIIINLLSNSIKYTPHDKNIFLQLESTDDYMTISIKDEGIGIGHNDQSRIFEPFYKGMNSENTEGSGLGLSLVKNAVNSLHGNIKFESATNEGSTFTVTIPYNKEN